MATLVQLAGQVGAGQRQRAAIIRNAVRRPGKQCEIVRLARMGQREGIGKERALPGELIDVRRGHAHDDAVGNDLRVGPVLFDNHDDMVRPGNLRVRRVVSAKKQQQYRDAKSRH